MTETSAIIECTVTKCEKHDLTRPNGHNCQMGLADPQSCIIQKYNSGYGGISLTGPQVKFAKRMLGEDDLFHE